MVVYALLFLAGVVLIQQLPVLPAFQWLAVGVAVVGISAWRRYWYCLFFVLGALWAVVVAMHRLADRLPEQLEGVDLQVIGRVADLPEQDEKHVRFDLVVRQSASEDSIAKEDANAKLARQLPSKLRLSWYYPDQSVKAGQHWSFTVKLKRVHGNLNPGGFDYERWLFTEGIGATGYVRPSPKPVLLEAGSAWTSTAVWRQFIADRLADMLDQNASLALIKALTIGDGSSITQPQWDVFRKTGTTHLIVISGSHIGLIGGLVYFLVLKFWAWTGWLKWSPQKVAAITAVLAAVFYSGLAGFSIPTQRSVVMLSVAMLAVVLQRNSRPLHTLAVALFAVLLFDPLAVLSAGFWLSFLAVALIVYTLSERLGKLGIIQTTIKINWATSAGLSPLLLLFFQQVSLIAPLANLVAVPVISLLVVPLSLLAVMTMFVSPTLAALLFHLAEPALQGLWWLLSHLAELPQASINHPSPSYWALLFAVPGILLLLAPVGMPTRWLSFVLFLPLLFTDAIRPEPGGMRMTLLDVGQGLSVVVQTSTHALVFDTGAKFSDQSDMGRSVVLPFLHTQGLAEIDSLIISHGDNDHIGGAGSLLREVPVGQVLTSVPERLQDYAPTRCEAGQSWLWDDVKFVMLSPGQTFGAENDSSCVLKIESKYGSVLLTGDIEAQAESWLVETYDEGLQADVLVAPHHGSKTSSTTGFLQVVRPDYVLIPAGYRSQFGHPHKDVLARYRQMHADWLNSANSGAITVDVGSQGLKMQAMRETAGKYWNAK
ncbi:MAG: DNA internalization-related competence protein ComEC/Rec2 [Methylobacter sp.]